MTYSISESSTHIEPWQTLETSEGRGFSPDDLEVSEAVEDSGEELGIMNEESAIEVKIPRPSPCFDVRVRAFAAIIFAELSMIAIGAGLWANMGAGRGGEVLAGVGIGGFILTVTLYPLLMKKWTRYC